VVLTTTPYNAEVKERVELYLYSTSGPSWPVIGRTLPYLYCYTHYFAEAFQANTETVMLTTTVPLAVTYLTAHLSLGNDVQLQIQIFTLSHLRAAVPY